MPPVPRGLRLSRCPQVPTVHTLPPPVVARIRLALFQLQGTGRSPRHHDVVGMLVTLHAPTTGRGLVRLLTKPHADLRGTVARLPTGRQDGLLRPSERQLWMRLPLPVTHRLNLLVELAHDEEFRTTRRQVVSALAMNRLPMATPALMKSFTRYLSLTARDARVPGRPLAAVLDGAPPRPGRRPMS